MNDQTKCHIIDKYPDAQSIIYTTDNFPNAHAIKKPLWKFQQMFIVTQDQPAVNLLTRPQYNKRFEIACENLKAEKQDHTKTKYAQKANVGIGQNIINDFLNIY